MKSCIIVIFFFMNVFHIYSQENSCDPKTIKTKPGDAVNLEKVSKRNSNPTIFDWTYGAFDMYSNKSSITLLQSPFNIDYDTRLSHFESLKDYFPSRQLFTKVSN